MDRTALENYFRNGLSIVKGWLNEGSDRMISEISLAQIEAGQRGSVGEIGVHQGKLLLLLLLTKHDDEGAFAIDPFVNSEYNLSKNSPRGIEILQDHISKFAPKATRLQVVKKYSTEVLPSEVIDKSGRARLLSIDGDHEEATVSRDMAWAEEVLEPYGIIIVDDFFNMHYPGVSAAVSAYLMSPVSRFKAFAISPGKLYLAQPEIGAQMRAKLRKLFPHAYARSSAMFGSELDVYAFEPSGRKHKVKSQLKKLLGR